MESDYLPPIVECLQELAGKPVFLSPADITVAKHWAEKGIPLSFILDELNDRRVLPGVRVGKRGLDRNPLVAANRSILASWEEHGDAIVYRPVSSEGIGAEESLVFTERPEQTEGVPKGIDVSGFLARYGDSIEANARLTSKQKKQLSAILAGARNSLQNAAEAMAQGNPKTLREALAKLEGVIVACLTSEPYDEEGGHNDSSNDVFDSGAAIHDRETQVTNDGVLPSLSSWSLPPISLTALFHK